MGSLVFVSLLTAVSNFEMNTFGPNFQARVFPEGRHLQKVVFLSLFTAFSCYLFIYVNGLLCVCPPSLRYNMVSSRQTWNLVSKQYKEIYYYLLKIVYLLLFKTPFFILIDIYSQLNDINYFSFFLQRYLFHDCFILYQSYFGKQLRKSRRSTNRLRYTKETKVDDLLIT